MAEEHVQRRLAAILAADVVGYSRMMGEDEAGTRARFNAHLDELIKTTIDSRQGRIVKTMGDGLLLEFRFDDLGPQEIKNIAGPIEKCVKST